MAQNGDMKLRFLHLSDLHFSYEEMIGENWPVAEFNRDMVTRSMVKFIKTLNDPFDFIIITGDIAYAGKREEYRVADVFCKRLLEATGVPHGRLYLVPGNHDVNRSQVKPAHLKTLYKFDDQDTITDILGDPDLFPVLMKKFCEFNDFAERAMGRRLFNEKVYHMSECLKLEKGGQPFRVNLMGLNSALFAGYDGDDDNKLALGLRQVNRAIDQMSDEAILSIGFFHHPFACCHQVETVCQNKLKDRLSLILTGHLHEPQAAVVRDIVGRAVMIGAGACFKKRTTDNHFNCVEIDLTTGEGMVTYYKYLPDRDKWKKDTDICLEEDDGHFPFAIDAVKENPLTLPTVSCDVVPEEVVEIAEEPALVDQAPREPNVVFIHDYLLPTNFAGRSEERTRLNEIIRTKVDPVTRKSVSLATVRAIGGIGKSCLLRQVVKDYQGDSRFPTIIWFSFYEARTEDEGYFFREVLSRLDGPEAAGQEEKLKGTSEVRRLRDVLCRHLDANPVLLILDGLEVIQYTTDESDLRFGQIAPERREIYRFLAHICNQNLSAALVSSRTALTEFSGVSGYLEIPLGVLEPEEGARLLKDLGVGGNGKELRSCSRLFAGSPLCLMALGKYMASKRISASDVKEITGDPDVFQSSTDGERLAKIINFYRQGLTPEQEQFLMMLSIHPRSVREDNFITLVKDYGKYGRDSSWVNESIIQPLNAKGLVEELKATEGTPVYNAHPLMKFAFSTWLSAAEQRVSHERWAAATMKSPHLLSTVESLGSLEELQPYMDSIEHYIQAGNISAAWDIFHGRGVTSKLNDIGRASILLNLGKEFEDAIKSGNWNPDAEQLSDLYLYIAHAFSDLSLSGNSLKYYEMQYKSTLDSGNYTQIVQGVSILCDALYSVGNVKRGNEVFQQLRQMWKEVGKEYTSYYYFATAANAEIVAGRYAESASLCQKALESNPDPFNAVVLTLSLADAYLALNRLVDAESTLMDALNLTKKHGLDGTLPFIYMRFTRLALMQSDIDLARHYDDLRAKHCAQYGLPFNDNGFLLVAECKYDAAIRQAESRTANEGDASVSKSEEIENLLILSQAWHGKGDSEKANSYILQAEDLMNETGCFWHNYILEQTKVMLGSSGA